MRFSIFALSALIAIASAQSTNNTIIASSTTSVISGTAPLTPSQSTEAACLKTCNANDSTCAAKCVAGNQSQNQIALCQGDCVQGDGTASANLAYENCLKGCIAAVASASSTLTTITPAAGSTGIGSTPTGTGANSGSRTTASGSSATSSNAASAATGIGRLGASVVGVLALGAAMAAL